MKLWVKVLLVTLLFGIPAFLTGRSIWPPDPMMSPTSAQLPFFIFLSILESLLFGLGISFIVFGWKRFVQGALDVKLAFIAVAWLLVSWWPHDNLHAHNGLNMQGLLYIEYGFHLTLMIAGVVLAYFFLKHSNSIKKS